MPEPSRALRTRLYKRVATPLGVAEVTLLDVPLDPAAWTREDEQAFDVLERRVTDGRTS